MKEIVIYNSNMLTEHQLWKEELAFWNDELKFFNDKLNELVKQKENKNALAKLDHYQNEFIQHLTVMGVMHEDIKEHENHITDQSKKNISEFDCKTLKNHGDFRKKFEKQRRVYSNLKKSFFRFLG